MENQQHLYRCGTQHFHHATNCRILLCLLVRTRGATRVGLEGVGQLQHRREDDPAIKVSRAHTGDVFFRGHQATRELCTSTGSRIQGRPLFNLLWALLEGQDLHEAPGGRRIIGAESL